MFSFLRAAADTQTISLGEFDAYVTRLKSIEMVDEELSSSFARVIAEIGDKVNASAALHVLCDILKEQSVTAAQQRTVLMVFKRLLGNQLTAQLFEFNDDLLATIFGLLQSEDQIVQQEMFETTCIAIQRNSEAQVSIVSFNNNHIFTLLYQIYMASDLGIKRHVLGLLLAFDNEEVLPIIGSNDIIRVGMDALVIDDYVSLALQFIDRQTFVGTQFFNQLIEKQPIARDFIARLCHILTTRPPEDVVIALHLLTQCSESNTSSATMIPEAFDVSVFVKYINSDSADIARANLKYLSGQLTHSANFYEKFKEIGGLSELTSALDSRDYLVVMLSIQVMSTIAFNKPEERQLLIEAKVLSKLCDIVEKSTSRPYILEAAIDALTVFVDSRAEYQRMLFEHRGLELLLTLLTTHSDELPYIAMVRCIKALIKDNADLQNTAVSIRLIPALISKLVASNHDMNIELLLTLVEVIKNNAQTKSQLCTLDHIPLLRHFAESATDIELVHYLQLMNIVANTAGNKQLLIDQHVLRLSEKLLASGNEAVIQAMLKLMIVLANHSMTVKIALSQEAQLNAIIKPLLSRDIQTLGLIYSLLTELFKPNTRCIVNFYQLGVFNTIQELGHLTDRYFRPIRVQILAALRQYAIWSAIHMLFLREEYWVAAIVGCLSADDIEEQLLSLQLLDVIVEKNMAAIAYLEKLDILPQLILMLASDNGNLCRFAASLSAKLLARNHMLASHFDSDHFEQLINLLGVANIEVCIAVLGLLEVLAQHSQACQTYISIKHIKHIFIRMMSDSSPTEVRKPVNKILLCVGYDYQKRKQTNMTQAGISKLQNHHFIRADQLSYETDAEHLIAQGGWANIYRGKWRGNFVAIKHVKYQQSIHHQQENLDDLMYEAALMRGMAHPNIMSIYGICAEAGHMCIVMKLVSRGALSNILYDASKTISWDWRVNMTLGIAHGIEYLHDMRVIHRDLKSHNIIIDSDDVPRITDFGVARKKMGSKNFLTQKSVGTLNWIPPEFYYSQQPYSVSSDIYSFAMVMFEIATRRIPFDEATEGEEPIWKCIEIFKGLVLSSRPTIPESVPEGYAELMSHCWHADPAKRPKVGMVVSELESITSSMDMEV